MTGHLQRLIQGTHAPGQSIHPLVGSIFTPPKDKGGSELLDQSLTELGSFNRTQEGPSALQPEAPTRAPRPLPYLAPPGLEDSGSPAGRTAEVPEASLTAQPLLFEGLGFSPDPKDPSVPREAALAEPLAARAPEPHRTRSQDPAREPDEIQIHIGRIEVTAIPPAPRRPAPKPSRASLNLGDYLKGRQR